MKIEQIIKWNNVLSNMNLIIKLKTVAFMLY